MRVPITKSNVPLIKDTLPALKVCHFSGLMECGNTYTFARLFFLKNQLALSLYCFERTPPHQCRISFAFGAQTENCFILQLPPKDANLPATISFLPKVAFTNPAVSGSLPAQPSPSYFAGEDEQGWYWGADLLIGTDVLEAVGCKPSTGSTFEAAVFYHHLGDTSFGSSAPISPDNQGIYPGFTKFITISY